MATTIVTVNFLYLKLFLVSNVNFQIMKNLMNWQEFSIILTKMKKDTTEMNLVAGHVMIVLQE